MSYHVEHKVPFPAESGRLLHVVLVTLWEQNSPHNDRVTSARMWSSGFIHINSLGLVFVGIAPVFGFLHIWLGFREDAFLCIGGKITGWGSVDNNSEEYRIRCWSLSLEIGLINVLMYNSGEKCKAESEDVLGKTPLYEPIQYNTSSLLSQGKGNLFLRGLFFPSESPA